MLREPARNSVGARAYLASFLAFRHEIARDEFCQRFARPFVIWEPGIWSVPDPENRRTENGVVPSSPTRGDVLCFELRLELGGSLQVGRAPECEVLINDATFSRWQLRIARTPEDRYTVAAIPGSQPLSLDDELVTVFPEPIKTGSILQAGNVRLCFVDSEGMRARLDGGFGKH